MATSRPTFAVFMVPTTKLAESIRFYAWGMYGFGAFDPNGVPVNVYEPRGADA